MEIKEGPGRTWTRTCSARYAAVAPASILGLSGCLFFRRPHGSVSAYSLIWRKLGTRKSRLETKIENEARSALLARLWCHLILENPANRAENPTRLCRAAIALAACGRLPDRSTKAGASTPATRVLRHDEDEIAHVRSTKAGASTPATPLTPTLSCFASSSVAIPNAVSMRLA